MTDRHSGVDRRGDVLFATAVAVVAVTGLLLRGAFEFRINTDATAYVSIARQCLAGGFDRAVNGYWGPLLSWLMTPLLAWGVAPLWAARLVELAAAVATLFAVRWLALQLGANRRSVGVLALSLALPLVGYALILVTPDVLLLFLLTIYTGIVLPDAYRARTSRGIAAGLVAGLAYLAKSYALPFFAVHFLLINLLHVRRAGAAEAPLAAPSGDALPDGRREARRRVLRNYVLGLAAFAVVAGPWVGLLTHKYGAFTFGTAGQRASAMVGPDYYGDDPVFGDLIPPPGFDATSYWDDPTAVRLNPWRPWQSADFMRHQLMLIRDNAWKVVRDAVPLMPFAVATLLFYAGVVVGGAKRPAAEATEPVDNAALPLLLTVALFTAGYIPIFVEIRYLWFVLVLLTLMTVLALQHFAVACKFKPAVWTFLATWLIVTCAAPAVEELIAKSGQGGQHVRLATVLARDCNVRGNLASNDRWDKSLFAAFHMGARYFGTAPETIAGNEEALLAALRKHAIDYYLVWAPETKPFPDPFPASRLLEVTRGVIPGLRVYAIPRP